MSTTLTATTDAETSRLLASRFIRFLESGDATDLFADNLFTDFTMPTWRLQADTAQGSIALRAAGHPMVGRVPRSRLDLTDTGFVLEVEEEWTDARGEWYCRELFRADVADGRITQLAVYCTGDWDAARVAEHRAAVRLVRP